MNGAAPSQREAPSCFPALLADPPPSPHHPGDVIGQLWLNGRPRVQLLRRGPIADPSSPEILTLPWRGRPREQEGAEEEPHLHPVQQGALFTKATRARLCICRRFKSVRSESSTPSVAEEDSITAMIYLYGLIHSERSEFFLLLITTSG